MALKMTRRGFSSAAASTALLSGSAFAQQGWNPDLENPDLGFGTPQAEADRLNDEDGLVKRNTSTFIARHSWSNYFSDLKHGAVLADTASRALYFWSEDESVFKLYPISVPATDELTRKGRTKITRKVVGPGWAPTPSMLKRNPDWPRYVPPGPGNPLGTHALHLSWQYYRIHGTYDNRKIGRRSSNGCIGLYNAQISELYGLTKVGTQVLLI